MYSLWLMLILASMSMPWNRRFTILSSSEWKVIAAQIPPGFSRCHAISKPLCISFSSLFTKIRMAWKVFVAEWECRCSLSFRPLLQRKGMIRNNTCKGEDSFLNCSAAGQQVSGNGRINAGHSAPNRGTICSCFYLAARKHLECDFAHEAIAHQGFRKVRRELVPHRATNHDSVVFPSKQTTLRDQTGGPYKPVAT